MLALVRDLSLPAVPRPKAGPPMFVLTDRAATIFDEGARNPVVDYLWKGTERAEMRVWCREVFAGRASLSRALDSAGAAVRSPMEAFPEKGRCVPEHDTSWGI